jgi:hypothetical protein
MNFLIAAQKAILNNADSTPERKERALAELRGIPPKDPRHADAQQVLSELGLAVAKTANLSPTPDNPDKRKYGVFSNAMFWLSMNEMQAAIDRYTGPLEAEGNRLADLMGKWCDAKDETFLDSFNDAAPGFVEQSLAALAMTWEQVDHQLSIWNQMNDVARTGTLIPTSSDKPDRETCPPDLVKYCKDGNDVSQNVTRASLLITLIWPTIKRTVKGWNEYADAAGMDRAAFGRMDPNQREKALYSIGWHPRKGLPNKGTENKGD